MSKFNLSVSPDFSPEKLASWHIFNTWLQKKLDIDCHLALFDSFEKQREAIAADQIDLIYANPADAAALVREFGEDAMLAASMRAMQSRARDNARDYCHWREVERLLSWLDGDAAPATRH